MADYAYADGKHETPSTGLRHPSLEEGAGKRCSECGLLPGSVTTVDETMIASRSLLEELEPAFSKHV